MNIISRMLSKASSLIDLLSEYLALAGGAIIVGLMLLISIATISRYFFGYAMAWSTEIGGFSLLLITFLGGPLLAKNNAHVSVDILPSFLGKRGKRNTAFFAFVMSFLVSLLIGWYGIKSTVGAFVENQMIVSILRTPKYILLAIITLGFILMAAGFLKNALKQLNFSKNENTIK